MNIFALDLDPQKAAIDHVDSHVVKMRVESCQLLVSTIHACNNVKEITKEYTERFFHDFPRLNSSGDVFPYGIGYVHHPCRVWVGKSRSNWDWLCELCLQLCREHSFRFGLTLNKQISFKVLQWCKSNRPNIPDIGTTPFALAVDKSLKVDDYDLEDAVRIYRQFYAKFKSHLHSWTKRSTPSYCVKDALLALVS